MSNIGRSNLASSQGLLLLVALLTTHAIGASCSQAADSIEPDTQQLQAFFSQNCTRCHGDDPDESAADVDLTRFGHGGSTTGELISKISNLIDKGYMPPDTEPPLSDVDRSYAVERLQRILKHILATTKAKNASPTIRRMNRFQYNNAVQDLLMLDIEVFPLRERMMRDLSGYFDPATGKVPDSVQVASRPLGKFQVIERHLRGVTPFPQDLRAEHGYDTQADHLTLSPVLMESFVRLSRAVVDSPDFNAQHVGVWNSLFDAPLSDSTENFRSATRERLKNFLDHAFRSPVDAETVDRYMAFAAQRIEAGASYEDAMRDIVAATLASPRFLYMFDSAHKADLTQAQAESFQLANRLASFLWVSIPDRQLLSLAESGELVKNDVLRQQVDRMLRDKRLKRFCDSFPAQWLQLERIISTEPDPKLYPQFYFAKYRVSMHMMFEPLLLFETLLIEDRSILGLIDSSFSYRSKLLDAWYRDGSQKDVGPPTKVNLERVPISDRRQGGVITNAAVLAMTSGPRETKPITRGAWLATVILNDPPQPPPANVPLLPEPDSASEDELTIRERFAEHRKNSACAGCHVKLDPLGFALENYDAAGIWRNNYDNGRVVDPSGELFARHTFSNIIEFKEALLTEKRRFAEAFTSHLLSFATARRTSVSDKTSIGQIVDAAEADDYRFHSLIHHLIQSEAFRR